MKKMYRLTQAGVDELHAELENLKQKRGEIADAIKTAREQGDLSENAEYQAARADQERNEARILEIENILQSVEVIKKPVGDKKVRIGSNVKLKNGSKTKEFQIVGTVEADPLNGKISDESPIGVALLGKKVGDSVDIVTPNDSITYEVIEVA
jgi:transcription elongation factor GreA